MGNINLNWQFGLPAGATSSQVSYARVDNLNGAPPTYINVVPNPTTSPAIIATNIPNGQYIISGTPIYPDLRTCSPTTFTTPPCSPLVSISAFINGGVIVVNYTAPSGVPKVRITIGYPNGGTDTANYVNDGNPISRAIPANQFGDYTVSGQSVCDEVSGFYSAPSQTVTVTINQSVPNLYALGNDQATICNVASITAYTSGGFAVGTTLFSDAALTTPVLGFSHAMVNTIIYNLDPTTGVIGAATGNNCGVNITGTTSLSVGTPNGSGFITAPAGSIVHVQVTANGPAGGGYSLTMNIPAIPITQTATNGTINFTFTMPGSGSITWTGNFLTTNSSGSGAIIVY